MLGGLARGAAGAAQKYGPSIIKNAPGMIDGVANIIRASKGREQELSAKQQEMFLGQLFGAGLSALPGILGGVSSIVRSARTQEEQLFLGSLLGAGLSALPGVL